MTASSKYIWMDGKLVDFENATVHFQTSALHYGTAVFEGIRCYATAKGPAIFRVKEHMDRLIDSALVLGFRSLPFTSDQLVEAAKETIRANGFSSCYIRPLIYSSSPIPSLNTDKTEARVGIAVWEWGAYLGDEAVEKGARAKISSYTRHAPNIMMTKAKIAGNYVNSAMAKTESVRLGFDEAIMLDPQGFVAECSGENLFLVRNGVIYTPPTATILEGITRDALFSLAADAGFQVKEAVISRDQLYIADEVFLCGTAAEVVAVSEIDFRTIGSGRMGPVARQLQQIFGAVVRGQHPRSAEWLSYI